MVGCRFNAKNSLDKNYLYLAEKHGAQVFSETKVVDAAWIGNRMAQPVTNLDRNSTSFLRKNRRSFTCRGLVVSGSASEPWTCSFG